MGYEQLCKNLIEIDACNDFCDNIVMVVPKVEGPGYTKETIRVEYEWKPPRCEVNPKTTFSVGKKNGSASGNSLKTVSKTNASTPGIRVVSLNNSFDALNDDNLVTVRLLLESVDNDMARYLASNPSGVGYGTKSLPEQWNDSYGVAEYDYDPYDNDMYKGQKIPDNLQAICDNMNIKVRGQIK
ncbi:hypothetical protein Tco_0496758 [Tanacetum coccineum]